MTRIGALGVSLGLAAGFALLKAFPILLRFGPPCFFHELTHLYCPGCGGTRAAILLLRGDLLGALRMNVFAVIVLICIPIGLGYTIATGRSIRWAGKNGRAGQAIAVFVVAFFVLRNVPIAPFTYLAPIDLAQDDQAHSQNRVTTR